jgi:DNA-binding response OmpR family regulator
MKKFLICDNDKDLLDLLGIYLRPRGYDFLLVSEGSKVMETLKNHDIRLLFLDLNLPDTHGTEIIKQIRKNPDTVDTIIVLFTASVRVKNNLDRMQVDGILEKPFDLKELERIINEKLMAD